MSEHSESKASMHPSGFDKDAGGSGADKASRGGYGDADQGGNPFSIPQDDLIFEFKDKEKLRKVQEREVNKRLKIWEKNRPTREAVFESSVKPTLSLQHWQSTQKSLTRSM